MAVAVAGPLLLLLLARPSPAATGDISKSGERVGRWVPTCRHGLGVGWRSGGGRGRDCDSPGGIFALTLARTQCPGPHPGLGA